MSKKDIIDYVMETPGNTNKKVLGRLIDEVEGVKLPEVTEDDNGNVLTVVEGAWDKAEPNGGSGGGVFMVEIVGIEGSSDQELKATWQEIYDAFADGKMVIAYSYTTDPSGSGSFQHTRELATMVSYISARPSPYSVSTGMQTYYCNTPDARPKTGGES